MKRPICIIYSQLLSAVLNYELSYWFDIIVIYFQYFAKCYHPTSKHTCNRFHRAVKLSFAFLDTGNRYFREFHQGDFETTRFEMRGFEEDSTEIWMKIPRNSSVELSLRGHPLQTERRLSGSVAIDPESSWLHEVYCESFKTRNGELQKRAFNLLTEGDELTFHSRMSPREFTNYYFRTETVNVYFLFSLRIHLVFSLFHLSLF